MVFGAHFASATAELFEQAQASGLRIISGLVLADRHLLPGLYQSPDEAYRESAGLIRRFHGTGRLLYAVTPRFAVSASEAILEVCSTLLAENPGVRFQTHMNESVEEIESSCWSVSGREAIIWPYMSGSDWRSGARFSRTTFIPRMANWSGWPRAAAP